MIQAPFTKEDFLASIPFWHGKMPNVDYRYSGILNQVERSHGPEGFHFWGNAAIIDDTGFLLYIPLVGDRVEKQTVFFSELIKCDWYQL